LTERSDQEDALVRAVAIFEALGLPYLVTGSFAISLYGVPRMTRDIDVVIDPKPGDAPLLVRAFREDGFVVFEQAVAEALRTRSMFNVIDERALVKIDIIVRKPDLDTDAVFQRAVRASVGVDVVTTIAPEDLIIAKLVWARDSRSTMQIADVRGLLRSILIDEDYLRTRAVDARVTDLLDQARADGE
jgi:hypothetical protein